MDEDILNQEPTVEDAVAAYLKANPDDDDLSVEPDNDEGQEAEGADEAAEDDEIEDDRDEAEEDDQESSEEGSEEAKEAALADDESEVVVTVNGQEHRVSVGDLKRLAGQETALTQRSQAVAEQRRVLEAQGLYFSKLLETRFTAAKARSDKFKDVDLFRASRELSPDEFDVLRSEKEAAEAELKTIQSEAGEFLQSVTNTRKQLLREQARESLKVITEKIPEWTDEVYTKVRSYAVSQGMEAGDVNEIVDPGAIVMMHKAMMYDEAKKNASEKVTKKVTSAPKRTLSKGDKTNTKSSKSKLALKRAQETGSVEDVAAAFLAATAD